MFYTFNSTNQEKYPCAKRINLINDFHLVWEQHVWWTRETIKSMILGLPDVDVVTKRLLQNPTDMAKIFARFYPPMVAKRIEELITEHLALAGDLVTALKAKNNETAKIANDKWYRNADEIAKAFASINPYYHEEEVKRMFYEHLDLTKKEAAMFLEGNFPASIAVFDQIEKEALDMADYFANGIMKQFPSKFID